VEPCHACSGQPSACAAEPPAAPGTCRAPFLGGKAKIYLLDKTPDGRDRFVWRWRRGTATAKTEFGNPLLDTDYQLCVYDQEGGVDRLIVNAYVPAGTSWRATRKGFRYVDKTFSRDGVGRVVLREGIDGKAAIVVAGKGPGLDIAAAALPLAQDVRVTAQLSNGTTCWEALYDTNRRNTSIVYKAAANP
jgi:hypothetical protein